jgi:type II secretory pathway pseudopilin PulG
VEENRMGIDRRTGGFTLVEIIISVAALGFICALVLKLFVLSSEVSEKALRKQHAIFFASDIIEVVKSYDDADEIKDDPMFGGAAVQTNKNISVYTLYADDSWETANDVHGPVTALVSLEDEGGSFYTVRVLIAENGKTIYELEGGKYFAGGGR